MNGVTHYLPIGDGRASEAVDFYKRAFDAEELGRHQAEDGKRLLHAHLQINGADHMLSDDFPEYHGGGATAAPSPVTLQPAVYRKSVGWGARGAVRENRGG